MNRIFLAVVILLLAMPVVLFLKKEEVSENATISGSFMEDVKVVNKGSGKDRWTLSAQKIDIPQDGKESKLSVVAINLPEHGMDVKSESGIYNLESRDLALSGNIEARTEDYVLKTNSIYVKSGTGEISSPDRVVLEGGSFKIEGDGFETTGDKKVRFNSNVKAIFY